MTAPSARVAVDAYILLVEDNAGDAALARMAFDEAGDETLPRVEWVQSQAAALEALAGPAHCAAVLLDLGLPDSVGLNGIAAVKACARDVPIVVLTGNDNDKLGLAAVLAGAQDFLVKGSFDGGLLRRSLRYAMHRKQIEVALVEHALHDELTGLPRRRLLVDRIASAQRRCARESLQGALLFVDLDRFKQINDQQGHATGDAVLREVAVRLSGALRASDTLARVGGDEFVVLLPEIGTQADAIGVARKLLVALSRSALFDGIEISLRASMGVAHFNGETVTTEELLRLADASMYAAKQAGGGRVFEL